MNPELTGFALGLLLGAAKVCAIGTVGFGIAWWRSRRALRELEEDRAEDQRELEELRRVNEELMRVLEARKDAGRLES